MGFPTLISFQLTHILLNRIPISHLAPDEEWYTVNYWAVLFQNLFSVPAVFFTSNPISESAWRIWGGRMILQDSPTLRLELCPLKNDTRTVFDNLNQSLTTWIKVWQPETKFDNLNQIQCSRAAEAEGAQVLFVLRLHSRSHHAKVRILM